MKIAVIGASGRTGIEFVTAALEAGHTVRAGVRGYHTLQQDKKLEVVECDALDEAQVRSLIRGVDVVVSTLGHIKGCPDFLQTDAMRLLNHCMLRENVSRVISLTGTGVRQAGDVITLWDRLLNLSISIIDPKRVRDGIEHARVLQESSLEYTIVRVLKLTDGKVAGFNLKDNGPVAPLTSRATVARAMLEALRDDTWVHKMPIVGR